MNKDVKVVDLKRVYDNDFVPSQEYLESMPDLQNEEFYGIPIDFVGIHNFHVPIRIKERNGDTQEVMASISGMVSLDAEHAGINMSRIIRTFYKSKDDVFDINKLEEVLRNYQKDLKTFDAHILMNFKYRVWQNALRSVKDDGTPEGGWQYYNVTFDCNLDVTGEFKKVMWVDFIYSSACVCSTALSEHAALTRGVYGIPHSQRSIARLAIEFDKLIWIEDVIEMCRETLTTETLVFCKRQDEQAFAEKNGAQPKFVEDASRMMANKLNENLDVHDFKVIISHNESLHSHNAIAVITKGKPGSIFKHHVTLQEWQSLGMI
jgi:GTP cyclohydrolase I